MHFYLRVASRRCFRHVPDYSFCHSFHSILAHHVHTPTYVLLNVARIFKTPPFGLAVLLCPVQSGGSPCFLDKCGYVTSQVACHRDRNVPWLFVTLIRIPDEPQCLAYFVTERTLPVTPLNGNCISVRVLQHRIRNYPYFRLLLEWSTKKRS